MPLGNITEYFAKDRAFEPLAKEHFLKMQAEDDLNKKKKIITDAVESLIKAEPKNLGARLALLREAITIKEKGKTATRIEQISLGEGDVKFFEIILKKLEESTYHETISAAAVTESSAFKSFKKLKDDIIKRLETTVEIPKEQKIKTPTVTLDDPMRASYLIKKAVDDLNKLTPENVAEQALDFASMDGSSLSISFLDIKIEAAEKELKDSQKKRSKFVLDELRCLEKLPKIIAGNSELATMSLEDLKFVINVHPPTTEVDQSEESAIFKKPRILTRPSIKLSDIETEFFAEIAKEIGLGRVEDFYEDVGFVRLRSDKRKEYLSRIVSSENSESASDFSEEMKKMGEDLQKWLKLPEPASRKKITESVWAWFLYGVLEGQLKDRVSEFFDEQGAIKK